MTVNTAAVVYAISGGLILYSGIKGATIAHTVQAALSGNLSLPSSGSTNQDEPIKATNSSSGSDSGSSPSSSPTGSSGPVSTGSQLQNGTTIYKFLRTTGGYSPIQAAGAIAAMWGESGWDPESVGTGGCGLMGWSPVSSISLYGGTCKAAGVGNNTADVDMQNQLGAILKFVSVNGDQSAVDSMKSATTVEESANIWGPKVERFGINDVHDQGVATAAQIAKTVDNVTLPAGD